MAALSFPAGIRPYRAGDTGYAQYMTAFNRNFGGSSGGGSRAGAYCHGKLRGIPIVQDCLRQANYDIKAIFCGFDARTVRACQENVTRSQKI